jgi:DNA topoisomerase-1
VNPLSTLEKRAGRFTPAKGISLATVTPTKKGKSSTAGAKSTRRPATASRTRREPVAPAAETPSRSSRARNLVVVESPTKARTVKNILGDDYEVIASVGHVRDLPPYGYGVESVEKLDFTPKYVVVKDKRRGVDKNEVVKDIAAAAKRIR